MHVAIKHYLPSLDHFDEIILFIETSEEMPTDGCVYRFIATLVEIGILARLKAILVGYPKAQFCGKFPPEGREAYVANQQIAVKQALEDYGFTLPVIFNLNFGHTDPQMIIPNGGEMTIDFINETIVIH